MRRGAADQSAVAAEEESWGSRGGASMSVFMCMCCRLIFSLLCLLACLLAWIERGANRIKSDEKGKMMKVKVNCKVGMNDEARGMEWNGMGWNQIESNRMDRLIYLIKRRKERYK